MFLGCRLMKQIRSQTHFLSRDEFLSSCLSLCRSRSLRDEPRTRYRHPLVEQRSKTSLSTWLQGNFRTKLRKAKDFFRSRNCHANCAKCWSAVLENHTDCSDTLRM